MAHSVKCIVKSFFTGLLVCLSFALIARTSAAQTNTWPTHSHDEQHSGVSSVASQPFNKIHWHTPVDLNPPGGEIFIHYGSPEIGRASCRERV